MADGQDPRGQRFSPRGLVYSRRPVPEGSGPPGRTLPERLIQAFRLDPALEEWHDSGPAVANYRPDRSRAAT